MAVKLQIKHGQKTNLSNSGTVPYEPKYMEDTHEFFVYDPVTEQNEKVNKVQATYDAVNEKLTIV